MERLRELLSQFKNTNNLEICYRIVLLAKCKQILIIILSGIILKTIDFIYRTMTQKLFKITQRIQKT